MLQIKTIVNNNPDIFDARVNEAIAEGWHMAERKALTPHGQYAQVTFYAELVRTAITENERDCEDGPRGYPTEWEPEE